MISMYLDSINFEYWTGLYFPFHYFKLLYFESALYCMLLVISKTDATSIRKFAYRVDSIIRFIINVIYC